MSTSYQISCLQAEADDDTGGNTASNISNTSQDVGNSGVDAETEVNNFMIDSFLTWDTLKCFQLFSQWHCVQNPNTTSIICELYD